MKNKNNKVLYVVAVLLVFFCGCGVMYGVMRAFPVLTTENVTKIKKDVTVTDTGIADAVEKIYDAVCVVNTYKNEQAIASGTGFIYKHDSKKYYLLTNYHVIENGDDVKVTFNEGEVVDTEVVGYNKYADIAVLKFESSKEYPVSSIGKSSDVRIGDTVFTVGAPLDSEYSGTVTRGIISGTDRMIEVDDNVVNAIQTDASINSGNSGGPLCNSNGEVIGINSLKLVSSGVEGMGFAIPIETAVENAEDIIAGVQKENPYIGISMVNLSEALSANNLFDSNSYRYRAMFYENAEKAKISTGVGVISVEEDSPASKSDLKMGDIIVKIDDKDIKSIGYLRYNLYKYNKGDTIKISYYRDGKLKETKVKLSVNQQTS